mgnify:FL=1
MSKKAFSLDGMIDTETSPKATGVPQRGAGNKQAETERRNDNMNIKMKPSTRQAVLSLADKHQVSIADLFEDMVNKYKG